MSQPADRKRGWRFFIKSALSFNSVMKNDELEASQVYILLEIMGVDINTQVQNRIEEALKAD
jgi:hypothetical protein